MKKGSGKGPEKRRNMARKETYGRWVEYDGERTTEERKLSTEKGKEGEK